MTPQTDTRLSDEEKSVLAGMIGKTLDKYCYSPTFSDDADTAFEVVELHVGGEVYTLSNALQVVDYYGAPEDVAVLVLMKCAPEEIAPWYGRQKHLEREVSKRIEDVVVYEDEVDRVAGREPFYYGFTQALAFRLDAESLVFERESEFSEDLDVHRGVRAESKVAPVEKGVLDAGDVVLSVNGEPYDGPLGGVLSGDEEPDSYRVERRVVSLREWAEGRPR